MVLEVGETLCEPLVATVPMPWSSEAEDALVEVQVSVLESLTSMLVGDAEMLQVGVGVGAGPPMNMICPGA